MPIDGVLGHNAAGLPAPPRICPQLTISFVTYSRATAIAGQWSTRTLGHNRLERGNAIYLQRAMSISWKMRILVVCAYLGPTVSGFGGFATRAEAQNAAPALSRSTSIAASTTQGADWIADEQLRKRVKAALHNDPHFYDDEHVTVSVEKGASSYYVGSSSAIGICETRYKPPGRLPVTDK